MVILAGFKKLRQIIGMMRLRPQLKLMEVVGSNQRAVSVDYFESNRLRKEEFSSRSLRTRSFRKRSFSASSAIKSSKVLLSPAER
jgi:hypothetical protein